MEDIPLARSGRSAVDVVTHAAREAGHVLLAHFRSEKEIQYKSKGNIVTKADILSEKTILDILKEEFPYYKVLSEESNSSTQVADYTWIVDPLDGTNNYAFDIPFFCINIALVKNEDILLGVTYDPVRDELFRAEKGKGAYLNDLPVLVSKEASLEKSLVGLDIGYNSERARELVAIVARLQGHAHCLRIMGSASLGLAYVACGRVSLYFHRWLYPWDIASGLLLIREAGGEVNNWQGKPATHQTKELIASNHILHQEFIRYLG